MLGNERWIPKNRKFRVVPFTIRAREVLEKLHRQASPKPDDLVIPNPAEPEPKRHPGSGHDSEFEEVGLGRGPAGRGHAGCPGLCR